MSERALPATTIVAAGIGMGFAGDQLLRAPSGPGLNFFLLFVGLAASIWIVTRGADTGPGREAWTWIGVGLLMAAALPGRGSGVVRFMTFVAAAVAFALPALEAGRGWVGRAAVRDVLEALVGTGLHAVFGSVRLLHRDHWDGLAGDEARGTARSVVKSATVGALLAAVPLVVFGALFVSADEVYATIAGDFVRIDLQAFAGHLAAVATLSWLACGYFVGFASGTRLDDVRRLRPLRPRLGVAEVATAMGMVDALFLTFVAVQFRYLFGGGDWVLITPGLTYAAYARAGFFQLVVAVGLAIPWLLATNALMDDRSLKARSVFGGFAGLHVALLLVIVASAGQRMLAYQDAYGLTEDRVVACAVLTWLAVVVTWFGATVLRGRGDRFAFGALATAFLMVGSMQLVDPAGLVARHNLDRAEELGGVDAVHLASLGSDVAPVLVRRMDELSAEGQCLVAASLLRSWGPEHRASWKSWNWSEARARDAVAQHMGSLRSSAGSEACG